VLDAQGEIYLAVNGMKTGVGADGKKIWDFPSPCLMDNAAVAAANGLVYFASAWGVFTAFDAQGRQFWSLDIGNGIIPKSSPVIGTDGIIYLGDGRTLHAYAVTNAAPLAKSPWPMFRANPQRTGRVQNLN